MAQPYGWVWPLGTAAHTVSVFRPGWYFVTVLGSPWSWKKVEFWRCKYLLCVRVRIMLGEDWVGPRNSVSVARPFLLYCCRKGGKKGLPGWMNAGLKMNLAPAAFFPAHQCAGQAESCLMWYWLHHVYAGGCTSLLLRWYFAAAFNTPIGENRGEHYISSGYTLL